MFNLTVSFRSIWRDPRVRELLVWCLPGVLFALSLRLLLTWQMPFAVYHIDSPDFLTTPDRLLFEHRFELHSKKTFLTPIVFTIPFLLHIPALIAIPVFQHLLGIGIVLMTGVLCRLWFTHWKIFIVPLSVIAAADPFMLWYEHTIMAETLFLFCTLLVAIAGTAYAFRQTPARFAFLCIALFLNAGARPEGKLLFGFGIVFTALIHFRNLRESWPRPAIMAVLAILTHFMTSTSQSGLLLYTSVARLTPHQLKCAPGFEPYIAGIRDDLQKRWDEKPSFPKVRDRRSIAEAVGRYIRNSPQENRQKRHLGVNDFCLKLASETCRRNLAYLPVHAYQKFRFSANEAPSGRLDNEWIFERQYEAYVEHSDLSLRLSRGLTGGAMASKEEIPQFVDAHYATLNWFNTLSDHWLSMVNAWRLPDSVYFDPEKGKEFIYRGIPIYFLLGAAGLIVIACFKGPAQPFHIVWALTLFGFFFTIMLTANIKPRFRFIFEPFWFIYTALLLECVWIGIRSRFYKNESSRQ